MALEEKINSELLAVICLLDGANLTQSVEAVHKELIKQGWIIHPVIYVGKIVGAIIERKGEIHTSIRQEYQKKWNPRPYIKNILKPNLEKYGIIYSQASKEDKRGIRWLTKLGFQKLFEDDKTIYYKLTNLSRRF